MRKRSKPILFAALFGLIYALYLFVAYGHSVEALIAAGQMTGSLWAAQIVTPHMVLAILADCFSWVAYLSDRPGFVLCSGVLFLFGCFASFSRALFLLPSLLLTAYGWYRMKQLSS